MLRLFVLCLLCLSCCQNSASTDQTAARINIGFDPQTLDPRKVRTIYDSTISRMLFEGLTRVSKSGQIELALAKDVSVIENGTRYRFSLRKSFWSNGEPVTSSDFAESWKSILDPHFPTDMAYQFYDIKNARKAKLGEIGLEQVGIQTPDPQTLIIDLEKPVPYFLDLVSLPSFFPVYAKQAALNRDWAEQIDMFVCNGPFLLKEWKHAEALCVAKNPRYWQADQVHLSAVHLLMIQGDTEMGMYEQGQLDWAGSPLSSLPVDALGSLQKEGLLRKQPLSGTYFFRVNTAEKVDGKKNPMRSLSFRKALALAINRSDLVEHVLQGGQLPARELVPPAMGLSDGGYFHDQPEKARSLLVDALLELDATQATLEPIKLFIGGSQRGIMIAQAVQKQWEQVLGIKVEIESVEARSFFQRISKQEYQIAVGDWMADFNDPINFLEVFKYKGASTNNTNWESPKYIDLLNQSALCRNSDERRGVLREAEQILMEQMPVIPLFHYTLNYLQSERLDGVALSSLGQIDFRWAEKR